MIFKNKLKENNKKNSYSQCGEDIIVDFIFSMLKINNPTYLDIGAHHPYYLSNTTLLYLKNSFGVSVEPDPVLYQLIKKERPKEISLNVGVGIDTNELTDFYVMNPPTLNTFSKTEAERYASFPGKNIKEIIKLPLLTVNKIIQSHFKGNSPNFISLDVEGLDFEIIKSFEFNKYRPDVFCIESLTYSEDNTESKLYNIIDFMKANDYMLYADTYINSIFVDKHKWVKK